MNIFPPTQPLEIGMDKAVTIALDRADVFLTCLLFQTCLEYDMEGPLLLPQYAQSAVAHREDIQTDMTIELLLFQLGDRETKREKVVV